jgi:hypothetical protein
VSQQQSSAARPDDAPVSVSKRTTPILSSAPRTMQRTTTCAIEWVRRCVDAKAASSNHARAGLTCHGRDATIAPIHSNAFLFASSNAALKRRKPSAQRSATPTACIASLFAGRSTEDGARRSLCFACVVCASDVCGRVACVQASGELPSEPFAVHVEHW